MGKKRKAAEPEEEEASANIPTNTEYGEPMKYDPTFKGPIQKRGCTDVICCLLFLVCVIGAVAVTVLAVYRGDPIKLLYPTDSEGNLCGYGEYEDKPNLFFFDLMDCSRVGPAVIFLGCPTPQICVKECPNKYWVWLALEAYEKGLENIPGQNVDTSKRNDMFCKYGINPETSSKSVQQLVEDEDCASYYVESSPVVGRCIPSFITAAIDKAKDLATNNNETIVDKLNNTISASGLEEGTKYLAILLNAKEYGMKIYQDVRATWWMMIIALGVAMILAFLWIILMRWIAGIMVWVTIIAFIALFSFATYYTFTKYVAMKDDPAHQVEGTVEFTTNLDYYWNLANTWLTLGIISAVILGITLLILLFLRTRIMIAIALIKETSRAVGKMIFTLFWPLFPFILEVGLFFWWGVAAVYLASSGEKQFAESNKTIVKVHDNKTGQDHFEEIVQQTLQSIPCDPHENSTGGKVCGFLKYGGDEYTIYLQIYMVFMLFWLMNFIVALGQMTLAGAFASYYWAFDKSNDIPAFPVAASFWRCIRYHLGSIAFGSLIIAIIQMIRVALEYIDHKLKGSENPVAKFLLKCLKCCFWCLEKFMKFINKNAYIMVAVYGKNFCTSAKNAFFLIMRNIVRTVVIDQVCDFLLLIGKLVIVGAVGILSFLFFSGDLIQYIPSSSKFQEYLINYKPDLHFYLVPIVIIIIGTFIIASAFFAVYGMGVDTLFLSFLEDLERNDGTPEKPYYMSKELMKILGKKNKKLDAGKKK